MFLLTENSNQQKILAYIRDNPGASKQGVVKAMKGVPSRITVLDILDKLIENEMIRAKKAKPNSQKYELCINNTKPIIQASEILDNVRATSFYILERATSTPEWRDILRNECGDVGDRQLATMLLNCQHLIHSLIFNALLKWTQELRHKDKETLTQLYSLTYDRLLEIQMKFGDLFQYDLLNFDWSKVLQNNQRPYECTVIPTMMMAVSATLDIVKEQGSLRELESNFDRLNKIQF